MSNDARDLQATPLTPPTGRDRLRSLGPGLLAAAAGVGAGDLVATLVAGARYGTALLWAAVLGAALKLALGEGVGRWHLASGSTMLDGWRQLGRWATWFFAVYIVIWGFVYGATAMSAVGLPLNALLGGLSVRYWAMIAGVLGLALVWAQRYHAFEKFVTVLVLLKFLTVVSVAVLVLAAPPEPRADGSGAPVDAGSLLTGLVPTLPAGSTVYVLGLIGGVGGTITMAAYGYWIFAKGWKGTGWLGMMRLDNAVGYVMTGIFVVAMLIVGTAMLFGQDLTENDRGLLTLGAALGDAYGDWARILFLLGFLAVTVSSLLGVWNGVSLLFADLVRTLRLPHGRDVLAGQAAVVGAAPTVGAAGETADPEPGEARTGGYVAASVERSWPFRGYLLWLTIPPMGLLFIDRPFALTLVYGVLGSVFMPFLAITLMLLLNSKRMPAGGRSGWLSNVLLTGSSALFLTLLVSDLWSRIIGG